MTSKVNLENINSLSGVLKYFNGYFHSVLIHNYSFSRFISRFIRYSDTNLFVLNIISFTQPGCDLNARDDIGYTPLHLCAEHGYIDMIHILLKHKAKVNINHTEEDDLYPIDAVDEPLRLALKVRSIRKLNSKNILRQNFFSTVIFMSFYLNEEVTLLLIFFPN